MKKLTVLFLLLAVLLCACSAHDYNVVSGEDSKSSLEHENGAVLYVTNISTKSYHLPSCYIVDRMKAENKYETYDLDFLLSRDYTPCKKCIKAVE